MAAIEDAITCKACGQTDLLTKKFICSKCGVKNWGHELPSKSNKGRIWELIVGILFLAGFIIYDNVRKYRNEHWSLSETEKIFSGNVVLVYHEFVVELEFDDPNEDPLYFIRTTNGGFTQWKKGMQPNVITGCGLIVQNDGTCVSTRNLTHPRLTDRDMINLKREVQIFRNPPFNIRSGGHYKLFTVKLGYYIRGTKLNDPASFNACKVTGSWQKDIEIMSLLNSNNAVSAKPEFRYIGSVTGLKKEDELYIIGYPSEMGKSEKLNTVITAGKIESIQSNEFYFAGPALSIPEGAPVFNIQGAVMGLTGIDEKGHIKAIAAKFERIKND